MKTLDVTASGAQPLPPVKSASNPLPGEQIKLTDDERATKFVSLLQLWTDSAWPADEVALRAADWKEYRCSERPSARKWPLMTFDGSAHSANIKFPILNRYVRAWTAQVTESVFAERPLLAVAPDVADPDPERAKRVEQRLDNVYEALLKYPRLANKWTRRTAIEGVGILHAPYRTRERFLLKRGNADGTQDGTFSTVYDGPRPEVVPLDRFRLFPNNSETIDDAWGVFYEYRLPLSEIETGRKPGKGPDGEVTPPKYVLTDEQWEVVSKVAGQETTVADETPSTAATQFQTRVNAVDVYCRYKYVKGQPPMPVVFTFLPDHNALIRATPCSTGDERPFVAMIAIPIGNGFGGIAFNRIIDQCVEAINVAWNQMDNQARLSHLLSISPAYTPALGVDLSAKPWLGAPLPCADANGIKWLQFPSDLNALPRIQFLLDMLEANLGVSSNAAGVQVNKKITATEVNTMATMGQRVFREQIELMDVAHVEAAELICWQYYLNGPDEIQYLAKPTKQELAALMGPSVQDMGPQGMAGQGGPPMAGSAPGLAPLDSPAGYSPFQSGNFAPGANTGATAPSTMPVQGIDPMQQQQVPVPQPPEWITRTIKAEDFAPGLTFTVRGSGAHMNRAAEIQEALQTREAFMQDPLVLAESSLWWEFDAAVLTAQRIDPETRLGPKPDLGTSVAQLMAKAAPPMPPPPEPKGMVSTALKDMPPDAQSAYLEKGLGLPGNMAGQGYKDALMALQKDHEVANRPEPVAPNGAKTKEKGSVANG